MNRKTLNIHFTKPKGHPFPIISWLIRLLTWSPFSHTVYEPTTLAKIFHVRFNIIEWMGLVKFKESNELIETFSLDLPEDLYQKLIFVCNHQPSKQKGYNLQLLGIGLMMPFKWMGFKKVPNLLARLFRLESVVCSEYIAKTLCSVGIRLDFDKYSMDTFSEKDLYNVLCDNVSKHFVTVDNRPDVVVITRL